MWPEAILLKIYNGKKGYESRRAVCNESADQTVQAILTIVCRMHLSAYMLSIGVSHNMIWSFSGINGF